MKEISWLEQWAQKEDPSLVEIRFDPEARAFYTGVGERFHQKKVTRVSDQVTIINANTHNKLVGRDIARHKKREEANAYEVLNDTTDGHSEVQLIYHKLLK